MIKFNKKILLIVFSFIMFIPIRSFNASSEGNIVNKNVIKSVTYGSALKTMDEYSGNHLWLTGYNATVNFESDKATTSVKSSMLCLDPTLNYAGAGSVGYNIYQIDMSNSYQRGLYNIYKAFYLNSSASDIYWYRAYFELAARAWECKHENCTGSSGIKSDKWRKHIVDGKQYKDVPQADKDEVASVMGEWSYNMVASYYKSATSSTDFYQPVVKEVIPSKTANEGEISVSFNFDLGSFNGTYNEKDLGGGKVSAAKLEFLEFELYSNGANVTSQYLKEQSPKSDITASNSLFRVLVDSGKVINAGLNELDIKIKYKWNHPLNPHNVYLLYGASGYQDMLLITDFTEEQEASFKISFGKEITVSESVLEKIEVNNTTPGEVITYQSSFSNCNEVNTINSVEYKGGINPYCSLDCDENITFSNLFSSLEVRAGQKFSVSEPKLEASKKCTLKTDNSKWEDDMETLVERQVYYYNEHAKYLAVKKPNTEYVTCSCSDTGCSYATRYTAHYYGFGYDSSKHSITSLSFSETWGGCAGIPAPEVYSNAKALFSETSGKVNAHLEYLNVCNNYLKGLRATNNFYKFSTSLLFKYNQKYAKSDIGTKWNDNRPNNIDDSKLTTTSNLGNIIISETLNNTASHDYLSCVGDVSSPSMYAEKKQDNLSFYAEQKINREYNASYNLSKAKKIDPYTYEITENTSGSSKDNLGYVYDVDISALSSNKNLSYYTFEYIGDTSTGAFPTNILEYFKNDSSNLANSGYDIDYVDGITRTCNYKITNNLYCIPNSKYDCCDPNIPGDCPSGGTDPKSNVVYRIVEPRNIDPNGRFDNPSKKGFENWENKKGKVVMQKIKEDAELDKTYSPDNLEYSFTLDGATLKKIREYNKTVSYSNVSESYSKLSCNDDGNECKSLFIDELSKNSGYFSSNQIVKIGTDGRKWKYLIYDGSTWKIDNKTMSSAEFKSLVESPLYTSEKVIP